MSHPKLQFPRYQFCICGPTDDAAHYLQSANGERSLNPRFRIREGSGEHLADHHIGDKHLLEQCLQPAQPVDTGQTDQRAGVGDDDCSHCSRVSRSALVSAAFSRMAGIPSLERWLMKLDTSRPAT